MQHSGGHGGGIIGRLIMSPIVAVFWVCAFLVAVGSTALAADVSNVSIKAIFTAAGIVISDADEVGQHVEAGQAAGDANDPKPSAGK